jgi:hypothetical protein
MELRGLSQETVGFGTNPQLLRPDLPASANCGVEAGLVWLFGQPLQHRAAKGRQPIPNLSLPPAAGSCSTTSIRALGEVRAVMQNETVIINRLSAP